MATTTNYGWTTPDDTALVKDGASAIRTLGTSVDTTTKNLNPETTLGDISYRSSTANVNTRLPLGTAGQVLKVNSGATAPEWATDASGMTNPMTTTGDTIYSSSGSTPARLAIGSTGQILTVAAGIPSWATPAGASQSYSLLSTTSLSGATTTISGLSGYNKLLILVNSASSSSAATELYMTINGSSTATDYAQLGLRVMAQSTYSGADSVRSYNGFQNIGNLKWGNIGAASNVLSGFMAFEGANSSGIKRFSHASSGAGFTSQDQVGLSTGGTYNGTSAISSITFAWQSGTLDAGDVYVYVSN
jgi:hypothetical protein